MTRRASRRIMDAALIFLLALVLTGCQPGDPQAPGKQTSTPSQITSLLELADVLRVIDGDTVTIVPRPGFEANYACKGEVCTEHAIRILGIDAPERNKGKPEGPECGAQEATDFLGDLLRPDGISAQVSITFDSEADKKDRYGRSLAYLAMPNGDDVGALIIQSGHAGAWYPKGEPRPDRADRYEELEAIAIDQNIGLYAHCPAPLGRT